jgi:hypothetical protein
VTQQISSNLQTAAQSATSEGNTSLAGKLNQLSTDFSSASTSGQLPSIQDLAQAIGGGGGHHHHHHGGGSSDAAASATTGSSSSNVSQFLQSLSASTSSSANSSLNPTSIIFDTLSSAGVQIH